MPSLFVANTSKQHHQFYYRLPEDAQPRYQEIRVGAQVQIRGNMSMDMVAAIIKQHEPYGLKAVSELPRNKAFVGLCYSIDKPVDIDSITSTFVQNDAVMNDAAEERRENSVAAIATQLQNTMQDHGVQVPRTEIEMVEETRGTPNMAKGYEVTREGVAPRHGNTMGLRGKRR